MDLHISVERLIGIHGRGLNLLPQRPECHSFIQRAASPLCVYVNWFPLKYVARRQNRQAKELTTEMTYAIVFMDGFFSDA